MLCKSSPWATELSGLSGLQLQPAACLWVLCSFFNAIPRLVRTTWSANRDIKLENTLLDASKKLVKLIDSGFAEGPEDSLPKSHVGTPRYTGIYLISQDIMWSLCCSGCMTLQPLVRRQFWPPMLFFLILRLHAELTKHTAICLPASEYIISRPAERTFREDHINFPRILGRHVWLASRHIGAQHISLGKWMEVNIDTY